MNNDKQSNCLHCWNDTSKILANIHKDCETCCCCDISFIESIKMMAPKISKLFKTFSFLTRVDLSRNEKLVKLLEVALRERNSQVMLSVAEILTNMAKNEQLISELLKSNENK